MSNKLNILEVTIGVEVFGTGTIDVKAALAALGVSITPSSEDDPGFAVNRKHLFENNDDCDFIESNGIIEYTQIGEPCNKIVTITLEVN